MRGLYGQSEGNERRSQTAVMSDRIFHENVIAEGEEVAALRRLVASQRWEEVTVLTAKLRRAGHSHDRVSSMLSRAMAGLKF
jgi:hypothetical protein